MKKRGFKNIKEYKDLIKQVDTSTTLRKYIFDGWKKYNGTKLELLKIIQLNKKE